MARIKRYAVIALGVVGGYMVLLGGLGFVLDGCVADLVEQRLSAALGARVEVGSASASLLRGRIEVRDVEVERERGGHLRMSIDHVAVDIAPLGWAVFDRDPDRVTVRGARVSISAAGALALPDRPEREPLRMGAMVLEDVRVDAMVTGLLPGLGQASLTVREARTGPVRMVSAIDWVVALRALDASTDLPAGITAGVSYRDGTLGVSGSIFGSTPVTVPFEMPVPDADALEAEKLAILVEALAEGVGRKLVKSWLRDKVTDTVRGVFE